MPEMDGLMCVKAIRQLVELHPDDIKMPFICCVTAYQQPNFKTKALANGMDSLVHKPVFKDQLQQVLIKAGIKL